MAKKIVTLSDGSTVTLTLDNFTRADWQQLAKCRPSDDEYDKQLAKIVKDLDANGLKALPWVDWKAIDVACGDLLRNPVGSDPS